MSHRNESAKEQITNDGADQHLEPALEPNVDWRPAPKSDPFATCVDRRGFMRGGAALFGGAALAGPLGGLMARQARAAGGPIPSPYGPIAPAIDQNTGLALIQLPPDFIYWSFGWTGDPLDDGTPTPALHDGMAVVRNLGNSGKLILCRNHEVGAGIPSFSSGPYQYAPMAGGGNVNLRWNVKSQKLEQSWASLSGTVRNCAGGVTPWGSWISGEETFEETAGGFRHGYNFDVHATGKGRPNAVPLVEMGRFSHEAVCVDPTTGYVYETEDDGSQSGFYRFLPNVYGQLHRGGLLQMLAVVDAPQTNLETVVCGQEFDTTWVDISDPDTDVDHGVFEEGFAAGGARFRRLEGCWFGLGKVYFLSTTGGPIGEGQVFEYDPVSEKLRVIYHSPGRAECENPDNLVVTPRGALILCEDNSGSIGSPPTNAGERMLGLTVAGDIFTFAQNNMNFTGSGLGSYLRSESGILYNTDLRQNEWAGACFSGDGQWLFVNIQTPGVTFAITGPWGLGPL